MAGLKGWESVSGVKVLGRLLDRIELDLTEEAAVPHLTVSIISGTGSSQSLKLILKHSCALQRYIREVDLVREILFALTGRPGFVFSFQGGRCLVSAFLSSWSCLTRF